MATVQLATSLPGLRAFRSTTERLRSGIKEHYVVGRTESGQAEWWARGKVWRSAPGSIHIKEPGDVHRDLALDGQKTFTVVVLPAADIVRAREVGRVASLPHLAAGDERAAPFHRLHDAVVAGADRLALEVALTEAAATFAQLANASSEHTRPVRRALEYLRARLSDSFTLDDVASHAALDKFHLCRAFRAQVGMPPHQYLTHLRVQRATELLKRGVRPCELAPSVGLYDQSQLTRHFRRIVGTTPARYASGHPGTRVTP